MGPLTPAFESLHTNRMALRRGYMLKRVPRAEEVGVGQEKLKSPAVPGTLIGGTRMGRAGRSYLR